MTKFEHVNTKADRLPPGLGIPTFCAMIRLVGLCRTCHTTPPLPAPSSPNFSKSSMTSSPTSFFCLRNSWRRSRCCSSSSSSCSFFWSFSRFAAVEPLKIKTNNIQKSSHLDMTKVEPIQSGHPWDQATLSATIGCLHYTD